MARRRFLVCEHCDIDLGEMTFVQGHDIILGHGQQLCKIVSRSDKGVSRRTDEETDRQIGLYTPCLFAGYDILNPKRTFQSSLLYYFIKCVYMAFLHLVKVVRDVF